VKGKKSQLKSKMNDDVYYDMMIALHQALSDRKPPYEGDSHKFMEGDIIE